jgi:Asp-tRNA(Asn)/Glu-tRNA(Gln) amidotransferase C subunit
MSVTEREAAAVAALARLRLEPGERAVYARQLSRILEHVDALRSARVPDVECPPAGPEAAPLRADRTGADPLSIPPAELAPGWVTPFFTVPRLIPMARGGPGAAG